MRILVVTAETILPPLIFKTIIDGTILKQVVMKVRSSMKRSFALILPLVFFAGCSGNKRDASTAAKTEPDAPAIEISVFTVQPEKINRTVDLIGTLEGNQEVTISSEVAARVIKIRADLGDAVQGGLPVVELDSTEFQLAVDRQRSALFQVLAQLGVRNETDALPTPAQTSIIRRAAADLADAGAAYERTKALVAKAVESKSAFDAAEARYQTSQANYSAAQDQVRNLFAQVDNLRTQLALAQKKLADCTIRAPFSGTVKSRLVEIGQYVREQTPIMSIASTHPLKLLASVPEAWFPYVAPGAAVQLTVEAYSDKFPCRVSRVSRAVDPQSRTFNIEGRVDNQHGRLQPGLFARATLTTSKVDSVVMVPAAAVISFYGVQKIYAVANGQIQERVVKLGDRAGSFIEVTQGLNAGESIATSELTKIHQGSRVQVKEKS